MIAIITFILLKYGFTIANNDNLLFLLKPIDFIIRMLAGSKSVYIAESGYFHKQLGILIDKSCAGFNFWILNFLMLTFLGLKYFSCHAKKLATIPIALIAAYLITIFVNSSRIFSSVVIQRYTNNIHFLKHNILHEAIGILINLTFLILTYIVTDRILSKWRDHAKLT